MLLLLKMLVFFILGLSIMVCYLIGYGLCLMLLILYVVYSKDVSDRVFLSKY